LENREYHLKIAPGDHLKTWKTSLSAERQRDQTRSDTEPTDLQTGEDLSPTIQKTNARRGRRRGGVGASDEQPPVPSNREAHGGGGHPLGQHAHVTERVPMFAAPSAAWADALDPKNAGAALFEPDLDHLSLEAILVLASPGSPGYETGANTPI
jgi:hypothetical protein